MYKHYTTFKEIDTAVLNKTMKKTDLRYDIQHGHCRITKQTPVPQNEVETIEINFAGLVDEIDPVKKCLKTIGRWYTLSIGPMSLFTGSISSTRPAKLISIASISF